MLVEALLSHTIHVPFHLLLVIKCDNVSMIISVEIFHSLSGKSLDKFYKMNKNFIDLLL